ASEPPRTGGFLNPALGRSWSDVESYAEQLRTGGVAVNVVPLAGHSAIRAQVLGPELGRATPEQATQIHRLVVTALRQGVAGVSLGLAYPAARDAAVDELHDVARSVALAGAVLCVHIRDERDRCVDAVIEALDLAEHSGAAL